MKNKLLIALLGAFLLAHAPAAFAEIYKWTDSSGANHFTDDINKVPAEYRNQVLDVEDEMRERDRELLAAERGAQLEKQKEIEPPAPEDPTDAAIQETLVRMFKERGQPLPTEEEAAGFIKLVRVWFVPLALGLLLIVGMGVGLTIHALINNNWLWVVGSIVWVGATILIKPSSLDALFASPLLWCVLGQLYVLPMLAYPPFKVGEDDREYLRWLLPALVVLASVIVVFGSAEGIKWTHAVIEARDIAMPASGS
ncbi:MAG: DUF4124 domain-containing protein [Chrysiogenetes bacterium]|nr:DUF4124 domain-containing protein [Chrysiogenetes bacterium]